ncbi:MAG TPA: citrate/2-methylcitrate synthase [Epulopiscium sp.]|nr:citrate/2-methylcitrate synthase [Candidatus Epulonipiscium sp.]
MGVKNMVFSEANLELMDELGELLKKRKIAPELYEKYNVKRGLRNNDGTGVLVGLTEVGNVHSYVIENGEKKSVEGELSYRGYDINDLVNNTEREGRYGFEETCYLLLFGELPSKEMLQDFKDLLSDFRTLPAGFTEDMILKAPSKDIMNKLTRAVLASYSYDSNPDSTDIDNVLRQCIELIARFPTMVAYGYQAKIHYHDNQSLYIHNPQPHLGTAENILHMVRPDSQYTKAEAELLDVALMIHAEHGGGNNSTFIVNVATSTGTDTYSAIAAAIGSLKGPLHGGANAMVLEMMENIKENVKNWESEDEIAAYIEKILRKEAFDGSGLIYGMGHAVYTLSDPRAILLKQKAIELAKEKGMDKEFNLYATIEKLTPGIFSEVKQASKEICANVDFYSGFVYNMLNIPGELHTPIFAIARIAGWCAHRVEELISGGRIIRPAYKNIADKREYIKMEDR